MSEQLLTEALAVLKEIEYSGRDWDGVPCYPDCEEENRHRKDCKLAAIIKRIEEAIDND